MEINLGNNCDGLCLFCRNYQYQTINNCCFLFFDQLFIMKHKKLLLKLKTQFIQTHLKIVFGMYPNHYDDSLIQKEIVCSLQHGISKFSDGSIKIIGKNSIKVKNVINLQQQNDFIVYGNTSSYKFYQLLNENNIRVDYYEQNQNFGVSFLYNFDIPSLQSYINNICESENTKSKSLINISSGTTVTKWKKNITTFQGIDTNYAKAIRFLENNKRNLAFVDTTK